MNATWKAHDDNKALDTAEKKQLPDSVYAFPGKRKEPMTNASHVRNAIARFDQVKDVTDHEREQAFANIKAAAKHYKVELDETNWHDLGKKPHTSNPAHKKSA
jgi:cell division protein FtsX